MEIIQKQQSEVKNGISDSRLRTAVWFGSQAVTSDPQNWLLL
jgi:hypothetical protein